MAHNYKRLKRNVDVFTAFILLIVSFPFLIAVAIAVYFSMGSPILFRQQRPGLNARPFTIYKFRTMHDEYGKDGLIIEDDKRLTPLGILLRSLSLDELPELLNVIKGDMSLVGPRPLLMEYLPIYNHKQARRHAVKPGITGWAQINGRNTISWDEKFAHDLWYVDNACLALDLRILWRTVFAALNREGINQAGHATAEKFSVYVKEK